MTLSAVSRKSISDLTRRRARAVFTVAALAIAVASIGLFALPTLMNRAMNREIAANKLADVTVSVNPLPLSAAQARALGSLPNVAAFDPNSTFGTYVYKGPRTFIIGKASFAHQTVDAVTVTDGSAPGPGAVLVDVQNAPSGHDVGGAGQSVRVRADNGQVVSLPISGEARNLNGAQRVASDGIPVLYATAQTVASLRGTPGYTQLAFRLHDSSTAAARQTVNTIRSYLRTVPGFTGFTNLPEIRSPGDWPGKSGFAQLTQIMSVITLLALLGALVLLSSTMTALVGEQTPEIATMKAIGARRKQIRRVYLRTATLLGAIGAVAGAVLGILLAWGLTSYFASSLFAISAPFSVDLPVVVACIALGVIGPPLAAMPAVRRAARLPLAETLQATGSATGPEGRLDRLLRRAGFLPRTAQIGLRGVTRRRRRSLTTVLQVSLAVATLLAFQSFATSVSNTVNQSWNSYGMNIEADSVTGQALAPSAGTLISSVPGVARVQPALYNSVKLGGQDGTVWALPDKPMYSFHLVSGRLLTPADQSGQARVVVVEQSIARASGTHLGQLVTVRTAAGDVPFTVVGIVSDQQDSGTVLYAPLTTMQSVLHTPGAVNTYWIQTTSGNHQLIDQTNARIEHAVATHGVQISTQREYIGAANDRAHYRALTTVLTVLGLLIVAISMVALINTITMVVLERTREIGILRCIGAHGRDVRRIFTTEGLTIALAGWLIGIPLGFGLAHGVTALVQNVINEHVLFTFPALNIPIALIGTIILALVVIQAPLHRAVRFKPGEALRYA
ncbi:MAG TPA: FtsX-like permease family protein [Solirubrobacteraceae bacterium]|nr:FtsX-like permease family protein [Solirubrobacteraceae bacterium]